MRLCVYTCLFGDYESLSRQEVTAKSKVPFICFTDDPSLTSDTWEVRRTVPLFEGDSPRSSRYPKICPHRFLPDFDASIYIDNSIALTAPPEDIFPRLLPGRDRNMACLRHSFRDTVGDEFAVVRSVGLDHDFIIERQRDEYRRAGFDFAEKVVAGSLLLRRHLVPEVIRCMEDWMFNLALFSRRDQLSFNFVAWRNDFAFTTHALDLYGSDFHRWPVVERRNLKIYEIPSAHEGTATDTQSAIEARELERIKERTREALRRHIRPHADPRWHDDVIARYEADRRQRSLAGTPVPTAGMAHSRTQDVLESSPVRE